MELAAGSFLRSNTRLEAAPSFPNDTEVTRRLGRGMNRLAAFGRSHRDVVASLALLALPYVVLAHAFVPGKVMSPADNVFVLMPWTGANPGVSPKNPRLSEVTLLFHPAAIHAADEIRSGHFPLWNPHTFGGAPFFANPQTAVLFPLTALLYVLPYSLVVLAVWAVYLAWTRSKPVRTLAGWTAAVALGVLLAAVQLLPFAEYSLGSAVLAYRREWMIYVPLPLRAVITTVMPYFYGSPASKDFWGPANFNEISVFVGVVPWLVMPVALVAAWSRRGTKFFTVVMALSAALMYGVPWVGALLARVPPLDSTIAARNADLLVFSLAVLCGLGLDTLSKLRGDARR